jgi:hypothetical protein
MYLDHAQTKPYAEYLQRAAREYQDAQYDMALVKQRLGKISTWLGTWMLAWGERLQAQPPLAQVQLHLR